MMRMRCHRNGWRRINGYESVAEVVDAVNANGRSVPDTPNGAQVNDGVDIAAEQTKAPTVRAAA